MQHEKSQALFERAKRVIPWGVNSPVRAFKNVGIAPVFADRAHGEALTDADGNTYTDYICSWGPLILGHSSLTRRWPGAIPTVCRRPSKSKWPRPSSTRCPASSRCA